MLISGYNDNISILDKQQSSIHILLNELFFWGFVKVGSDTYILREDRIGDECQDYYDNCYYKKEGG